MLPIGRVAQQRVEQAIRALERVGRLEQGHDVEASPASPAARQGEHVEDVLRRTREADDVALAGLGPKRSWMSPMARNVSRVSSSVTPSAHLDAFGARVAVRGPAPVPRTWRGGHRCAAGPRARGRGSRTSRPASAAPGPRRRRRAPGRRRRGTPGARRAPRAGQPATRSRARVHAGRRGGGASAAGARRCCRSGDGTAPRDSALDGLS